MSGSKRTPLRDPLVSMRILSGESICPSLPPTIGRIGSTGSGARIAVADRLPLLTEEHTVAVIWLGESPCTEESSVPVLCLEELPSDCMGRIALLDPSCGRLFVSPDLMTLDRYARRISSHSGLLSPHILKQRLPRLSPILGDGILPPHGDIHGGALLLAKELGGRGEEERVERLCSLSEPDPRRRLTLLVDCSSPSLSELHVWIRSAFRAAVYGHFSLLLGGIASRGELSTALREVHSCFCELEAEGREFNGYLSKGLMIDSPLLLCADSLDRVDRLCYDPYALSRSMMGGREWREDYWSDLSALLASHAARHSRLSPSYFLCDARRNSFRAERPTELPLPLLDAVDSADEIFAEEAHLPFLRRSLDARHLKKEGKDREESS